MNTKTKRVLKEQEGYDVEEDDSFYVTRPPTSIVRRNAHLPPGQYTHGNVRYNVQYAAPPPVRSRQAAPLPKQHREVYIDESEPEGRRRRIHWLVWLGAAVFIMVFGWIVLSSLGAWVQAKQDDLTYGQVRHYSTDAVVGHNDSSSNPSHFIAENDNGNIYVIELPGGDSSKARIFQITTITGNQGNPPVKLIFQDVNRDGRLDMIVQIGDPGSAVTIILFNNGTTFVSKL